MLVAAVSSYREGPGLRSTLESAAMLDRLLVFEGPAGPPPEQAAEHLHEDPLAELRELAAGLEHVELHEGTWLSDAAKRTAMLRRAQGFSRREGEPLWLLWLDGDELLLWGQYLRDVCRRADAETGAGGHRLRIVELDGSVALCYGKLVRGELLRSYLESSYQVELLSGMVLALPNLPICGPGGVPVFSEDQQALPTEDRVKLLAELRPPLQGEPHLLHRSILRDPSRGLDRLSEREPDWYERMMPEVSHADSQRPFVLDLPPSP